MNWYRKWLCREVILRRYCRMLMHRVESKYPITKPISRPE